MNDYSIVVGVDDKHLKQLALTFPTWVHHKPSLLKQQMIVFFDRDQVTAKQVEEVVYHPHLLTVPWPVKDCNTYQSQPELGRFGDGQRYKMLAGFVYVPAMHVHTRYWLKLDTDVVATGMDDWVDPAWFEDNPTIVAHRWSFTKPADQMVSLDRWASKVPLLQNRPELGLTPKPGAERLGHKRIISWCGFFSSAFSDVCAYLAQYNSSGYHLPVPSQDGFMWYCAARLGKVVRRVNMRGRGFEQWSTTKNVQVAVERVLQ